MTPFQGTAIRLSGVSVGEIHIRRIGPSPTSMAKLAFVDVEGTPVSLAVFSAMSPRTLKLISALCSSIEEDYIEILKLDNVETLEEFEQQEGSEEGINFGER